MIESVEFIVEEVRVCLGRVISVESNVKPDVILAVCATVWFVANDVGIDVVVLDGSEEDGISLNALDAMVAVSKKLKIR